jgi:hypothetical protein
MCWDGTNLDSDNHVSHVSFSLGLYNIGECPGEYPQ